MKRFLVTLAVVILALAGAIALLADPDIGREEILVRYGDERSAFLPREAGGLLHYRDEGPREALPLILLHGSNASLHTWEPWVARLDDDLRLISIDLPAHGLTGALPDMPYDQAGMAAAVVELADALGLARFAIAGNSMGGGVAARIAALAPRRVTHLILVDAGGLYGADIANSTPMAFRLARTPGLRNVMLHVTPRFLFAASLADAVSRDEIITEAMIDRYWELGRMAGTRAATLDRLNRPNDPWLAIHLMLIEAPTLILWGAADSWTTLDLMRRYEAGIRNSQSVVFEGVGHLPQEEVPDASADAVRDFLLFQTAALPRPHARLFY